MRTAAAVCASPLRCEYGLSGTKIRPWFAAAAAETEAGDRECSFVSGTSASKLATCLPIALVYSSDAPEGA